MGAPVKYTCPDINAAQKRLREADSDLDCILGELKGDEVDTDEVRRYVDGARALIGEVADDDLEMLRTANDKLRDWGEELEKQLDEAQGDLADAERECEALGQERDDLLEQLEKARLVIEQQEARWALLWAAPLDAGTTDKLRAAGLGPPGEQLDLGICPIMTAGGTV